MNGNNIEAKKAWPIISNGLQTGASYATSGIQGITSNISRASSSVASEDSNLAGTLDQYSKTLATIAAAISKTFSTLDVAWQQWCQDSIANETSATSNVDGIKSGISNILNAVGEITGNAPAAGVGSVVGFDDSNGNKYSVVGNDGIRPEPRGDHQSGTPFAPPVQMPTVDNGPIGMPKDPADHSGASTFGQPEFTPTVDNGPIGMPKDLTDHSGASTFGQPEFTPTVDNGPIGMPKDPADHSATFATEKPDFTVYPH